MGAEPEVIALTRPPRMFFAFLKTIESQHQCANVPVYRKLACLLARALSTSHFLHPVAFSKFDFNTP